APAARRRSRRCGRPEPHDPPMDVVERYVDALARFDWDAFGACLADDVVRVGPFNDVRGSKAEYVGFLSELMPTLPGYSLKVHRITYADRVALAEMSETMEMGGEPTEVGEVLVFDLDDNGLITRIDIFIKVLDVPDE